MTGSRAGAAVVSAIALIPASLAPPALAAAPTAGPQGIGDYLFPQLGNPGYDARHYDLGLRYPTAAPAQPVDGVLHMDAVATQKLRSFNLDFSGDGFGPVIVNGRLAQAQQAGEDIAITPKTPIRSGAAFSVVVPFKAHIFTPAPDDPFPFGWFATADGSVTAFQPNVAHLSYPVNDHPSDKATYTFLIDVPRGVNAVANGVSGGSASFAGRTVYRYDERNPMASELVQVTVGDIAVIDRGVAAGVRLRDVASNANKAVIEPALARTPTHMRWMVGKVGPYPFENYGVLAADQVFFYALETQTLSLHPELLFDP